MAKWLREEPESLPFNEVWNDIVRIVSTGITLSDTTTGYHYRYSLLDNDVLQIESKNNECKIPKDDLADFWDVLRIQGMVSSYQSISILDHIFSEIIVLLGQLAYCRLINITPEYDEIDKKL